MKRVEKGRGEAPRKRVPHCEFALLELPEHWKQEEALRDAWEGYLDMRIKKRAKPTERAIQLLAKELQKHAPDAATAIAILDQSTANNWTGVFGLKPDQKPANLSAKTGHNPLIQS